MWTSRAPSPRALALRPVESPAAAVDGQGREILSVPVLAALAQRPEILVHPVHDHDELEYHPVHAEGEQDEDRVDDDQREEAAGRPAVLEPEAEEDQRPYHRPDGGERVQRLDDLRRDEGGEAEVEERADEAFGVARRLRVHRGARHARRLPSRRRLALRSGSGVALPLVALVLSGEGRVWRGVGQPWIALALLGVGLAIALVRHRLRVCIRVLLVGGRRGGRLPGRAGLILLSGVPGGFLRLTGQRLLRGGVGARGCLRG